MPHRRQNKAQSSGGNAKKGISRTVCALCGRTITEGAAGEPVIYSICPSCKRMPHRKAG